MIFKEKADDIVLAASAVTARLLRQAVPEKPVVIKPNIVTYDPPPVTTDVRVVEGIVKALRHAGIRDITVAEGSGCGDTIENLCRLGYSRLGIGLRDLDKEETVPMSVKSCRVWDEIKVPAFLLDKFIVSVPVLKEHSMCHVTISLKNMVGVLPERYYSGYWTYKKSQIHRHDTHGCVADLVSVISPDWAIVDATIGMRGSHLSGDPIMPPLNIVYGSPDPLEADMHGCSLLGENWRDVQYLRMIGEDRSGQDVKRCTRDLP